MDLLGIQRGRCRKSDCPGCDGFSRPISQSYLFGSISLFLCKLCGCQSKDHERLLTLQSTTSWYSNAVSKTLSLPVSSTVEGDSSAPPEADKPATGSLGANTITSIDVLDTFHYCRKSANIDAAPLQIGTIVRLAEWNMNQDTYPIGIIQRFVSGVCPASGELETFCKVCPLASSMTSSKVKDVTIRAEHARPDFHYQDFRPPECVGEFELEHNFPNLVYQPGGCYPLSNALRQRRLKLCILGGSISLQKSGYRSSLIKAFERRGVVVEDIPAAIGTAGSKPLSLVVNDLVLSKKPDLLIIEAAVNDGDELLENTPFPDVLGVLRAAEGIVRTTRRRSPGTTVIFLEMFLRDDAEARILKTGSEAWRDTSVKEATGWYHDVVPLLHRHVCQRYGLAQIDLIPAMRSLSAVDRQKWFRDDCHHTDFGGERTGNLLARLLLWSVRQPPLSGFVSNLVPRPIDAASWSDSRTIKVLRGWLSPDTAVTTMQEKDLLRLGEQADWFHLQAGGKVIIPFKGRACGLMTLLGPDAPNVLIRVDDGPPRHMSLLDRWCYYWRDAVVLLCDDLADTTHILELVVEENQPDASVLKRKPVSELWDRFQLEAKQASRPPQKLWLLYACVVQGEKR
jgi:hypothetical protein